MTRQYNTIFYNTVKKYKKYKYIYFVIAMGCGFFQKPM